MHRRLVLAFVLTCSALFVFQASAQTARTIRVTGSGKATASPNYIVIRGTITNTGESAKDALTSFTKAKDALVKVLEGASADDREIQFAGERLVSGGAGGAEAAFAAAAALGGDEVPEVATNFSVSEEVVIRVSVENDMHRTGILKELSTTIDSAGKAGLAFGSSPNNIYSAMGMGVSSSVVQFGLDETGQAALQAKAATAAYEDAVVRATVLAKLAGGRVGKVVSVEEVAVSSESGGLEAVQMTMLARMMGGPAGGDDGTIDHNGSIEMQHQVVVTFELVE